MIGVGTCAFYPLTISAAAKLGDRSSSQNVASLTLAFQVMLFGTPVTLGFIARHCGIPATFVSIVPFVAAAIWLARRLAPRNAEAKVAHNR